MALDKAFKKPKKSNFRTAFFRMAIFQNHDHMPDQTKPNQTSQSGILHFVQHIVRAYQKKFQLNRSNGSWDTRSGKFKIWKMSNLGYFEKWPPEAPKKGKNQFWWVPWWFWTPMLEKKNSSIFGTGCHKACRYPLNGAIYITLFLFIASNFKRKR